MPELMSSCWPTTELERIMAETKEPYRIKKEKASPERATLYDSVNDAMFQTSQSPKKSRGKESSKHFGVRFRPDLAKWVAEIRVAEWRTVDKKVWLGTFDSEEGAARAVDAARKLLKCKKKRPPNFDCEALMAYSESIPTSLDLNNLRDDSMFKEVTLFVKRKAQEYAASLCPGKLPAAAAGTQCVPIGSEQLPLDGSDVAPPGFFMGSEGDLEGSQCFDALMEGMAPSSCGSYETQFPGSEGQCYGMMIGDVEHQWSPISMSYSSSGPPSCSTSSTGTSPVEGGTWDHSLSNPCYYNPIIGSHDGWMSPSSESQGLREDSSQTSMEMVDGQYPLLDSNLWNMPESDMFFLLDDEQGQGQVPYDHATMDIYFNRNEMMYVDGPNNDAWMLQQNCNPCSMDYTQVC